MLFLGVVARAGKSEQAVVVTAGGLCHPHGITKVVCHTWQLQLIALLIGHPLNAKGPCLHGQQQGGG